MSIWGKVLIPSPFLLVNLNEENMNKPLHTLNEYEAQRRHQLQANVKQYNGLQCPVCKQEMFDERPGVLMNSLPPQKFIACDCGYQTTIIA